MVTDRPYGFRGQKREDRSQIHGNGSFLDGGTKFRKAEGGVLYAVTSAGTKPLPVGEVAHGAFFAV
jgi:hypothetical protein